jgi:hypothetical protein
MNEHRATYSPEDNKLRLYIGRVPREEYLKLKAEGWTTLHKQRDAGGGDFAATWTPQRRDTALEYAGIIEDEDMGPDERAADRAERFSGYRDKREGEATERADTYEAGPSAHGYQSEKRAERAAARHDRIGSKAVDAWDKAEYWQRRTAGVIAHALYVSSPGVRMGRIKTIEAELRKTRASLEEWRAKWLKWQKCAAIEDAEKQTVYARHLANFLHESGFTHPKTGKENCSMWGMLDPDRENAVLFGSDAEPITGKEACALFFARYPNEPKTESDWTRHLELRLAYENQMIEAQGGRAASLEMVPGGKLGGHLIVKVNKSPATGRVTSVLVKGQKISGWTYKAQDVPGADYSLHQFETERLAPGAYIEPTEASLKELEEYKKHVKATKPKNTEPPLINPTDEDAERLQAIWNERARVKHEAKNIYSSESARASHTAQFKPAEVCRIKQETYSAHSKGAYARAETRELCADAMLKPRESNMYSREREAYLSKIGPAVCKIRITSYQVIVLTDKPQKPLPAAVWQVYAPEPAKPDFALETEAA